MGEDRTGLETVSGLAAAAARIAEGAALADADAEAVLATHDIVSIGMLADDARRRRHGPRTTFVRVFEVHVEAAPAALPPRCSPGEIRIVGVPAGAEAAIRAVRAAAKLAAAAPVTGFSLADLQSLAGSSLIDLCTRLREAGLQAVAEAPLDRLDNARASVETARGAGLAVLRLTVDTVDDRHRLSLLKAARELQRTAGGFRAFAPLPRATSPAAPTTGYDDVKLVALARLLVDNIESIQVDWPLYGPKLAQVALTMGADDVDGIAAFDTGMLGTRRSPVEEILGNIRAAALDACERDGLFSKLIADS